jgi:DNA-directed RNA polymerase subunit RPC12/RpoP
LALMKDALSTEVIENHPVPEWVRCPNCGPYSSPGTKICSTCGAQIST